MAQIDIEHPKNDKRGKERKQSERILINVFKTECLIKHRINLVRKKWNKKNNFKKI